MKFDINSVSELSESELETIYGGGGGFGEPVGGAGAASSSAFASERRIHSFSVLCDINLFSLDANIIAIPQLIGILSPHTQVCLNND